MVSFMDPLSVLHLAQSTVMDKETLKKSLTSKAWGKLIRHSSLQVVSEHGGKNSGVIVQMWKREDLKVFVKILHFMELEEVSPFLRPILDLICESSPVRFKSVEMICPCRPEPHSISPDGFLLLEQVEAAFGTAEQSLKSVGSFDAGKTLQDMLSAVSSRMSRQKETVTYLSPGLVIIEDKSNVEAFVTLMQAEMVSVSTLNLRRAELGEMDWQALAGALRAKGKAQLGVDGVAILRKFLTDGRESIKDIWDATNYGFFVSENIDDTDNIEPSETWQCVAKSKYNEEEGWTRLKQIADMTEDEFAADCKLFWGEDSSEEEESEGEEEESGEDEGDEEEDHDGEEGDEDKDRNGEDGDEEDS